MTSTANIGEACGLYQATGQPLRVRWVDGRISDVGGADGTPDCWIAPGLFDIQTNGFGGIDFQQDGLSEEQLLRAVRKIQASGCTRLLLTLITADWPSLTSRLRNLRDLRANSLELQSAIAGWHIEGPFLSKEPGFHGAHDPALLIEPTPEHILELRSITENDPLLLTMSPEVKGVNQAIQLATARGIKVSIGHTNASAPQIEEAIQAGATAFTHLANGCPRLLDRHDNILWRILSRNDLIVSLIPDGIHVSPALFQLMHRLIARDSICYTTDAMSAAGMPPGRFTLGKLNVEVGADQVVRQPGQNLFAGSALTPIEGVVRAAKMLDLRWQEVWSRLSQTPAKFMGIQHELAVGQPADFCLLRCNGAGTITELQVYKNGARAN